MTRKKNLEPEPFHAERIALHIYGATPDREVANIKLKGNRRRSRVPWVAIFWSVVLVLFVLVLVEPWKYAT